MPEAGAAAAAVVAAARGDAPVCGGPAAGAARGAADPRVAGGPAAVHRPLRAVRRGGRGAAGRRGRLPDRPVAGRGGWPSAWLVWVPGAVLCVCALVPAAGRAAAGRGPRRAGCSTSAGPPVPWPRTRARATGCCSSTTSSARPGSATRRTSVRSPTSRWPSRRTQAGNFRGVNKPVSAIRPLMLGYQRIWVVGWTPERQLGVGPVEEQAAVLRSRSRWPPGTTTATSGSRCGYAADGSGHLRPAPDAGHWPGAGR